MRVGTKKLITPCVIGVGVQPNARCRMKGYGPNTVLWSITPMTIRVRPIIVSAVPDLDTRVMVMRRWFRPAFSIILGVFLAGLGIRYGLQSTIVPHALWSRRCR